MTEAVATPDVSVLVVSFNTRALTLACLRSILDETRESSYEIIVVDNASSDGSPDAIASEFPGRVSLVRSDQNLGFAAANNLAAERAHGRRLLLLNPDTLILDGAIDALCACADQRPEARIWGGRTVFSDGSLNPSSCWRRMTLWGLATQAIGLNSLFRRSRFANPEAYGGWDRSSMRRVDIVSGCFLLIDRDLWRDLRGFDPRYFMYGEEADLCLRARRHGARPLVIPGATIVHYGGASETVRADKLVRLLGAKSRLIRDHFQNPARPLAMALMAMWPFSRALAWTAFSALASPRARAQASVWREVWRRRAEWRAHGVSSGARVPHEA